MYQEFLRCFPKEDYLIDILEYLRMSTDHILGMAPEVVADEAQASLLLVARTAPSFALPPPRPPPQPPPPEASASPWPSASSALSTASCTLVMPRPTTAGDDNWTNFAMVLCALAIIPLLDLRG